METEIIVCRSACYSKRMITVPVSEIQRDLLGYLQQAKNQETMLVVTSANLPTAEIKPIPVSANLATKSSRSFGVPPAEITIPPEFFDPLPKDLLRLFEGESD